MRKFYASFLFVLLFSNLSISQTVPVVNDLGVIGPWENAGSWYEYDGTNWNLSGVATNTIPEGVVVFTLLETIIKSTVINNGTLVISNVGYGVTSIDLGVTFPPPVAGPGHIINNGLIEVATSCGIDLINGTLTTKPGGQISCDGGITESDLSTFIIESDATGTGSLIYDGALSGTFEQYISAGQWHLLGIPVSSATLGDFNPASGDGYMRSYIPGTGWDVYLTNEADVISVGEGYEYWTTVDNTVSVSGTFNTGSQTNSLSSAGNKYNLIANPYPCSIDWTTVADRANVDASTMYLYANTSGTEGYYAVNGSGVSNPLGANKYIPPFQAIFVEQSSGSTMNFTDANKAHGDKAFYKQSDDINYSDLLRLHVEEIVVDETMYSELVILKDEDASNGYDVLYDTKRLGAGGSALVAPSIYAVVGDEKIIINSISNYPAVVPFDIEVVDAGSILLTISEFTEMQDYTKITLEDRETNEFYDLNEDFSGISFDVEPGTINDRFFVHYSTTVGLNEFNENMLDIYSNRNTIYVNKLNEKADIQIYNVTGQLVYSSNLDATGINTIKLDQPSAYYIVHIVSENINETKKILLSH